MVTLLPEKETMIPPLDWRPVKGFWGHDLKTNTRDMCRLMCTRNSFISEALNSISWCVASKYTE